MAEHPIVDLRVLKDRTFATGTFLMTMLGFVLYASLMLLPIFLQTLLGYPALQSGLALSPRGIGSLIMMPIVGQLTNRYDPRKLIAVGLVVGGWTMISLSHLNLNAGYWDIFWPQVIQGGALAFLFIPADGHQHVRHRQREDGQRHQHLQPDAQHRRQLRHRHHDDLPGAPRPGAPEPAHRSRHPIRSRRRR